MKPTLAVNGFSVVVGQKAVSLTSCADALAVLARHIVAGGLLGASAFGEAVSCGVVRRRAVGRIVDAVA